MTEIFDGHGIWKDETEDGFREVRSKMTRKRLLFFDIDGTLIADNHQIPVSVYPALKKAHDRDCLLFINTGRTLCNMDPRLEEIPFDGMITGCGTRVICQGKTLQAIEYEAESSRKIRHLFLKHGIPTVYECDTGMYFEREGKTWPDIEQFISFSDRAGLTRYVSDCDPDFRIVKMFSFAKKDAIDDLLCELKSNGYSFNAIDRGRDGWEIVPDGYSKATGIEMIRKKMGVSLDDCYAFGDSTNDSAMLAYVPNSVAMGNAPNALKQACRYVAPRPEEDGIAKMLLELGLI